MNYTDLNVDFLKTTQKITSFNIKASYFHSLKYKKELQYLFWFHFFPNFDMSKTINRVDKNELNKLVGELKMCNNVMFPKLHAYNLKGIGPGETTLFFLLDNAHLGGGSSASADLIVDNTKYEVKSVTVSRDRVASNFKLGGTVPLADILLDLNNLRTTLKLGGTRTEISGSIIKEMKEKRPEEYKAIDMKYAKISYDEYFKSHKVIFINNLGNKMGIIEEIKNVKLDDISIERVTNGTIKPKVQL